MDDNCGEWFESIGVLVGMVNRNQVASGWNFWVSLSGGGYIGVVSGWCLRRYIDFRILIILTPLVLALYCSSIPTSLFI